MNTHQTQNNHIYRFAYEVRVSALCVLALVISGCATPLPTQEIDRVVFSGDAGPMVSSAEAFRGDMTNLAAHESLVVARAVDGSGALSQPKRAEMVVVEPVLAESSQNTDLMLRRCDIDGDRILDRHCPELFNALDASEVSALQFVSFDSRYTINADPDVDRDYWGAYQVLNTADAESREMPVTLKLLTTNQGNKTFEGEMDIYINIPQGVSLGSLRLASKVKSRAGAKAVVNTGLMVLGALATGVAVPTSAADSFFDDFAPIDSDAVFEARLLEDNRMILTVSNIEIEPNHGVTIEYDAIYTVDDSVQSSQP